ncbi:MAG: ABC transporter ATP-binding protein/permease, partial [Clostridia bacterium]|nr:ABC transporter ATP-binding protein/permease [Clostridia bacterium]
IFKFVETITDIVIPLLVANMIDVGVSQHDMGYIIRVGSIVVALNVLGIISAVICAKLASKAQAGISYEIRKGMYAHINTFSHAELDKFGTATLNNRITHDVSRIDSTIGTFLRTIMRTPFMIIGATVMAMIIDLKLSLLFLVISPLILGAVFIILKKTGPLYDRTQRNLDKVSEITRENLEGARVVRAFNKQDYEEQRFATASKNLRKSAVRVVSVASLLNPMTGTIINFAIVAVMWFGGLQVNVGQLTQGQIIAFVNYLTQISSALVSLANLIVSFIKSMNCAKRIGEVFETQPSVVENNSEFIEIEPNKDVPKIEFKNVSFAYSNSAKPAVKNLSFKAYPGQTIGIIGGTGSGKSSIIHLISRFYDTTKGDVFVDGINVKDYSFAQLRKKIGLVPQKAVLFKGTLRENLSWRKEDATLEEIQKAVKISQSEEFVKDLTDRYEFKVQAGGKNFSGGQRQRLTIARALVGDPEILIMDDSASALDFATDANLRKAIKENIDSTVVLVSQRANTVRNADLIIVMDGGNIAGMGNHKDLLENCDVYKEIYESQLK